MAVRAHVEGFLNDPAGTGAAMRLALQAALRYHVAAAAAWGREADEPAAADAAIRSLLERDDSCPRLARLRDVTGAQTGATRPPSVSAAEARSTLWACAADRVSQAEKLLNFS